MSNAIYAIARNALVADAQVQLKPDRRVSFRESEASPATAGRWLEKTDDAGEQVGAETDDRQQAGDVQASITNDHVGTILK